MTFPATPLPTRVEINTGSWMDITRLEDGSPGVYGGSRDRIRIKQGFPSLAGTAPPASCGLQLNNRDGRFSPHNPLSPYYGLIGQNTPIRVRVLSDPTLGLALPGVAGAYASTPDHASLDIAGDLVLAVEATLDNWRDAGTVLRTLVAKRTSGQASYQLRLGTSSADLLQLVWSTDGSAFLLAGAGVELDPFLYDPTGRLAVMAVLDVDNGAAGRTIRFYTAASIAGPWAQLGSDVIQGGVTSIFAGTAALEIGSIEGGTGQHFARGTVHAVLVRDGIGGTIVADPMFEGQDPEATSFVDSTGKTWTINGTASLASPEPRFSGEVIEWPQRWDKTGTDVWVPLRAQGISYRLGQGDEPYKVESTPHAYYTRYAPQILIEQGFGYLLRAYWPMEEGSQSSVGQPAIGAGELRAFTWTGAFGQFIFGGPLVNMGFNRLAPWLNDGVRPSGLGGQVTGMPTNFTAVGQGYTIDFILAEPNPASGGGALAVIGGGAGANALEQTNIFLPIQPPGGSLQTEVWVDDGTPQGYLLGPHTIPAALGLFDGHSHHVRVRITRGASDITVFLWVDGVQAFTFTFNSEAVILDGPAIVGLQGFSTSSAAGHLAVYEGHPDSAGEMTTAVAAAFGQIHFGISGNVVTHIGPETAAIRIRRLCGQAVVPARVHGGPFDVSDGSGSFFADPSAAMGPQYVAPLLEVLTECADTDGGLLHDARDFVGLEYRTRASLYNQGSALEIDYISGAFAAPPEPTASRTVRNDVTVRRRDGGTATAVQETGLLNVQDPPAGVGRFSTRPTVNAVGDGFLPDQAAWRRHLGTVDEDRYPRLALHLHHPAFTGAPDLTEQAVRLRVGDRLTVINTPPWLPPEDISQLVAGYEENLWNFNRDLIVNGQPASGYEISVVGPELGFGAVSSESGAQTGTVSFDHGIERLLADPPAGILVLIIQNGSVGQNVVNVEIGGGFNEPGTGVQFARVGFLEGAAGAEDGSVEAWLLSPVPVEHLPHASIRCYVQSIDPKHAVAMSVHSLTGTVEVEDVATLDSAGVANPSVTFSTAVETILAGVLHSGHDELSSIVNGAGFSAIGWPGIDFVGTQAGVYERSTYGDEPVPAGSPTLGWTAASDEAHVLGVALRAGPGFAPEVARADTAGSSLAADFDAGTDTSMSVNVDVGPLWTTEAAELPLVIEAGGVRLEVTAIAGASSPQTFTITQAPVNGVIKTIPEGTPIQLAVPAVVGL